jgi:hypothetical protein
MERPLRLTAHGGFGEGDGETHLSEGRKVRPVPTLRSGGGVGDRPADHNLGGETRWNTTLFGCVMCCPMLGAKVLYTRPVLG